MGVNLNGSTPSVSPGDGSLKLQHPAEGKSSLHKVTLQTGRQIVGIKLQLVSQGQKALHERAATVAEVRDTWLLNRGAGGSKKDIASSSELAKNSARIEKKERELNKAVADFKQAAARFEARLEQQVSAKELQKSRKELEGAEKKVARAGADLNQKLTGLEKGIQAAVVGKAGSVLEGFYDPPADKLFGKQDKAVLEIRQKELSILTRDLQEQLTSVKEKQGNESEVRLLKQQLSELSASGKKLQVRIGKGSKFHEDAAGRRMSEKSAGELKARHADFRAAVRELGESRIFLDLAIRTDSGTVSDKPFRLQAENRYRQAESGVSDAISKLRKAEDNFKTELGKDRKAAAQEAKKNQNQVKNTRGKTAGKTSLQESPQRTQIPEHEIKKDTLQPARLNDEQHKIQGAPEQTARTDSTKDLEKQLLMGHRPEVRKLLQKAFRNIQAMKTPEDVYKQRAYIDRGQALPEASRTVLMKAMNRKIMSLMQHTDFAVITSSRFVDDNVYGRQAQEKISLVRLKARDKRLLD